MRPANTKPVPSHWIGDRTWWNMLTDSRIEKNFRVVVIRLHVSGPNVATVTKMKCCTKNERIEMATTEQRTTQWRRSQQRDVMRTDSYTTWKQTANVQNLHNIESTELKRDIAIKVLTVANSLRFEIVPSADGIHGYRDYASATKWRQILIQNGQDDKKVINCSVAEQTRIIWRRLYIQLYSPQG